MSAPGSSAPVDPGQRILEERALALAKPQRTEEAQDTIEVLVIGVGTERYGIGIHHVREVRPLGALTPVPGLPPIWGGLVNLRGALYPVLDTARYLDLEAADGGSPQVVLVSSDDLVVGLLADEVVGLRSLIAADIGPPLEADADRARGIVSGVTADLLLLLDANALLGDPKLMVDENDI